MLEARLDEVAGYGLTAAQTDLYRTASQTSLFAFAPSEAQQVARLGNWNDELAKIWRDEADVIIIQQINYPDWQSYLDESKFVEIESIPIPLNCEPDTYLRVFNRAGNAVAGFRYGAP